MFLFYLFISISLIFFSLSVLGLFRFPDVYTKLHSSALSTTFGFIFFVLSIIFFTLSFDEISIVFLIRAIVVLLIILLTGPCVAHAISKAAYKNGIKP
ncbi:MAG: monovalent cation/H(+) antiporter subunit G [Patescibacteria group bacterium]|nr:monovalent cation/H(+) antiporter subunit G [Patescibacteria group bacterium]